MVSLIGVDVGTSATKALAVDRGGAVVGGASRAYPTLRRGPGWSEQDPEDWVQAASNALRAIGTIRPAGLAFTGQMHGLVLLDGRGRVLRPAILWNDGRARSQREQLARAIGSQRLFELVANPSLPGLTALSLLWVREHEPEVWERVRMVLLPKDYVRWRLAGGDPLTDVSDASGTLLFDVRNRRWSREMLDALGLDPGCLPEVAESPDRVGTTPEGVPVAAGAGDQAATALGVGLRADGGLGIALGTSGVVAAVRRVPPSRWDYGVLQEICSYGPDLWQTMGVTLAAGGSIAWWQQCSGGATLQQLMEEAIAWDPGCEGLTFLPHLSGQRVPVVNESARGSFVGASAHHNRGALTRAVLEGVACSLADVLELVEPDAASRIARVSGGLAKSPLASYIIASVLGIRLEHVGVDEGASYGAALLAGVAAGVFDSVEDAAQLAPISRVTEPGCDQAHAYSEVLARYRTLDASRVAT